MKEIGIMKEFDSKRLHFRRIQPEDSKRIFECWASDDEVTRYVTWPTHQNAETTAYVVDMWIKEYDDPACYRYGIELKETGELIGMIDVVGYIDGNPEIGYVLGRAYWSSGYMTEALQALTQYLFSEGFDTAVIEADERNIGSNSVIRKKDFVFTHKETRPCSSFKPELVTVNWYKKNRPEKTNE